MKKIAALIIGLALTQPALAGSSTVNYNSTGSSPFATTTDGSSYNYSRQTIWDYSAAANGAGVDSSHGILSDPALPASWGLGATGAAVPANAAYMGMIVGGNLTGIPGTAYGASVDENTSSQLHTDLAAPPNQAYAATYGACVTVTSGNNPWCGDGQSTPYVDVGAWAATALGAPSNFGTTPGAVKVIGTNDAILNWAGTALGAPSNFGTPPGPVEVPGHNAAVFMNTGNAQTQPHICGSVAHYQASTNSDLTVVPVSGSTVVYVCDYAFEFTGVGAFYFESATTAASPGSTCSGSLTQLADNTWTGEASVPIGKGGSNSFYRGLNTGASHGLCIHTTTLSATTLDITVYYDQY